MRLFKFDNIDSFLEKTLPILTEFEVENNLILGIAFFIQKDPDYYKDKYLAVILEDNIIKAISLCTSPHKLLFWAKNKNCNEEINLLVNDVVNSGLKTMGVLAQQPHAQQIVEEWKKQTGRPYKPGMSERMYRLSKVTFPRQFSGSMRFAELTDLELICKWMKEFGEEATPNDPMIDFTDFATGKIKNKHLVIWEDDGQPVSLASKARNTINGTCINLVYTPEKFRRNGYATSLVAHLSQFLLNSGWKFIVLFTDLSNPTSNSIYQKIGFRPVCDFQEYNFIK